jgi:hypothetical protein
MSETPKPIDETKAYFCPDCWAEVPTTARRCDSSFLGGAANQGTVSFNKKKVAEDYANRMEPPKKEGEA